MKHSTEDVFTFLLAGLVFGGLLGVALWQLAFDSTGRRIAVGWAVCAAGFFLLWVIAKVVAAALNHRGRQ